MPRKSRIDAPGALQHVIGRGINRQAIFSDKAGYKDFLYRLGEILSESNTSCYAWALIPNHFHLLLRMGMEMSPEEIMERGKEKRKVEARSILCYWATDRLGNQPKGVGEKIKADPTGCESGGPSGVFRELYIVLDYFAHCIVNLHCNSTI